MRGLIFSQLFASVALSATIARRAGDLWQPAPASKIQMVLSGTVQAGDELTPKGVDIFDVDLFDTPASTIQALRNQGIKVICYFSAGTGEDWRPDYNQFTPSDLGSALPDWQGEKYLNLRSANVLKVMQNRIKMASDNGCDAIDPDNMDAYSNNGGGFGLTQADSATFVKELAAAAREYGLSTGLKNAQQILGQVKDDVQFAVNEECRAVTKDCNLYDDFVQTKPVYHIEYAVRNTDTDIRSTYDGFTNMTSDQVKAAYCLNDNELEHSKFSTIIKELSLGAWVLYCDGSYAVTPLSESGNKGGRGN